MYNIYDELNKIIDYIESHITEEINIKKLAKLIGQNEMVLKNIFTCLTGISISEYIRFRRLSLAVNDIINGESITDISYKYLYSFPSSFHRAFKDYHGISPSKVKNNPSPLRLFHRIYFKNEVKDYQLEYKIYKDKEFILYGQKYPLPLENIPEYTKEIWKKIKSQYPIFTTCKRYGFLKKDNSNTGRYYCLIEKPHSSFEKIVIPKHHYFSYKIKNNSSKEISNNIKKGVVEYITSLNYHKLDSPNIEVYHTDFIEIMIPIC